MFFKDLLPAPDPDLGFTHDSKKKNFVFLSVDQLQ